MFSGMDSLFTPLRERLDLAAPSRSPPATQVNGDTDEIVIDGQLDHQRYQVPAATHELFQEKQFDYQYSGILSS